MSQLFKIALCQIRVTPKKSDNIARAKTAIEKAMNESKPDVVVLPEYFNSTMSKEATVMNAEQESDSPTLGFLREMAAKHSVNIIGGSIPERRNERYLNTNYSIDRSGEVKLKYSKLHLFDIDIKGKFTFQESAYLDPGNTLGVFQTDVCKFGVGICYDIRFPEYASALKREKNIQFMVYPAAFNMHTGNLHWELLQRARALDNNVFVATCSPSTIEKPEDGFPAWGNSTVTDPFAKVLDKLGHEEGALHVEIDLGRVKEIEQGIPSLSQKRLDVYTLPSFKI